MIRGTYEDGSMTADDDGSSCFLECSTGSRRNSRLSFTVVVMGGVGGDVLVLIVDSRDFKGVCFFSWSWLSTSSRTCTPFAS